MSAIFAVCMLSLTLYGCQKQGGPAERAGKSIDNATEKVGDKLEKAGEKIQDAAKGNSK